MENWNEPLSVQKHFSSDITKERIVFDLEIGLGNNGKIKQEGLKKFSSSEGRP